eukprot:Cvel_30150.t1-p1 / transcript=Cvel_30150.t1 / gene=Cvel_30150 / organism=Chromera_velia_CCMP2878 / gene_product=hypothetical protein / transcript_product=hypothetical protein / location=Cvel_scaffold4258:1856-3460(-) / protein_length=237 / sequence_SO=supercontig / SO=protein_coding / is_pseudo=false
MSPLEQRLRGDEDILMDSEEDGRGDLVAEQKDKGVSEGEDASRQVKRVKLSNETDTATDFVPAESGENPVLCKTRPECTCDERSLSDPLDDEQFSKVLGSAGFGEIVGVRRPVVGKILSKKKKTSGSQREGQNGTSGEGGAQASGGGQTGDASLSSSFLEGGTGTDGEPPEGCSAETLKRLQSEFKSFSKAPTSDKFEVELQKDSLFHWRVRVLPEALDGDGRLRKELVERFAQPAE